MFMQLAGPTFFHGWRFWTQLHPPLLFHVHQEGLSAGTLGGKGYFIATSGQIIQDSKDPIEDEDHIFREKLPFKKHHQIIN